MKKIIVSLLFLFALSGMAVAQKPTGPVTEELSSESFSILLKDHWAFARDLIDQLNRETEQKGEFETTPEFQGRVVRTRQVYWDKLQTHFKETKLDRKTFSIWFKANLVSYSADSAVYHITTPTTVDAPYDLPTVKCIIPQNKFVILSDSIRGGYRTSSIRLHFEPDFKWFVDRAEAMTAKGVEGNISFRVNFTISFAQSKNSTQVVLSINPLDIALMNQASKYVYWKADLQ
jgi:hypothetical protein